MLLLIKSTFMKRLRQPAAVLVWVLVCTGGRAQDIHFSQFFEAPLLRNPSLAGIFTGDTRVQGVYRQQWNSVTVPYQTGSLNAEFKLPVGKSNDFITAGMQILYDKAGSTSFQGVHALPAINYHKSLSADYNRYLSLGFMGGYVQRSIDRSKITTNNQYGSGGFDPSLPSGETFASNNYSYWDGSVGLSYNSNIGESDDNNYFLGVAYHHFNKPRVGFYEASKQPLLAKYVFSGGIRYHFGEYSYITVQADHSSQGPYKETIGGALLSMKLVDGLDQAKYTIHGGAFIRWKDAIIPVVKLDYSPFSVSFSYDINTSQLKPASRGRGGFEVSVAYIGFNRRAGSAEEAVRCPRF
jgi:type IX secretion system PorP/SprF family membrane protein